MSGYVFHADVGVTGVGDVEHIVKALEKPVVFTSGSVGENPREFGGERIFFDAVVVVESGLGAPADMQSGGDVGEGPVHDAGEFVPVSDLFKGHGFHGGAGDDEAVELFVAYIVKGFVEFGEMLDGGVFGLICSGLEQLNFHLEGGIAQ